MMRRGRRGTAQGANGPGAGSPGRRWVWGVFLVSLVAYVLATPRVLTFTEPPTGDQPFYLQTAISLIEDHDINENNNYNASASYNQFYPVPAYPPGFKGIPAPYPLPPATHVGATKNRPATEWYSKHGLGVPVLIIPGWLIGKALTVPFAGVLSQWTVNGGGGWPGTVFEFNILGALLAVQVFLFAWETSRRRWIAVAVWAALAFSNPQMSYSLLLFPELPAALLALYAFRRLYLGWRANARWQLLLIGLCMGYIPWLHARFLPITLGLAVFAAYQWWKAQRVPVTPAPSAAPETAVAPAAPPRPWPQRLGMLALAWGPVALSGVLLMSYYYWLYGSPLPNTQDHAGFFVPFVNAQGGLILGDPGALLVAVLGLFLDQQWGLLVYAPVFALAVIGLVALWRVPTKRAMVGWLALVIVPYFLIVADYRVWWGEWCPPARYLATITPLLAAPLAQSLVTLARSPVYKALYTALAGLGVAEMGGIIAGLGDRPNGNLPTFFNHPSGVASLFIWLAARFHLNLTTLIPGLVPWFGDHNRPLPWLALGVWVALFAVIIIGGLLLLDNRRQEAEDRVAFHNYVKPAALK